MRSYTDNMYKVCFFCGMTAPIFLGIVVFFIGFVTPGYDPVANSVSLMGTPEQPYAWLLNCSYCLYSVMMFFAAYGLFRLFNGTPQYRQFPILLGIHAMGTILLAVFPDSTTSFPREMLHNGMSFLAYAPVLAIVYRFRDLTGDDISFSSFRFFGLLVLLINIPIPFVHMFEPLSSIGGLLQRMMSGSAFLWICTAFFFLYRAQITVVNDSGHKECYFSSNLLFRTNTGVPVVKVGNILQKNHRC